MPLRKLAILAFLACCLLAPAQAGAAPLRAGDWSGHLTAASFKTGGTLPELNFALDETAPFSVIATTPLTWMIPSIALPASAITGLPAGATGTITPTVVGPIAALLDPKTGAATSTLQAYLDATIVSIAGTATCHIGSAASPIPVHLATTNPGGASYTDGTGAIKLTDTAVALPAAVCDNSAVAGALNTLAGLPTNAGAASFSGVLTLVRPATGGGTGGGSPAATTTPPATTAAPTAPTAVEPRCVVPRLRGRTLRAAKRALRHAHCKVGHVSRRHVRRRPNRVLSQSRRPGARLAEGTRVGLRVGKR